MCGDLSPQEDAAEVWIYQAFEVAGRHADLQLVDDPPACDDLENNDPKAKKSLFLVKGPVLAYSGARYLIATLAFRATLSARSLCKDPIPCSNDSVIR